MEMGSFLFKDGLYKTLHKLRQITGNVWNETWVFREARETLDHQCSCWLVVGSGFELQRWDVWLPPSTDWLQKHDPPSGLGGSHQRHPSFYFSGLKRITSKYVFLTFTKLDNISLNKWIVYFNNDLNSELIHYNVH